MMGMMVDFMYQHDWALGTQIFVKYYFGFVWVRMFLVKNNI